MSAAKITVFIIAMSVYVFAAYEVGYYFGFNDGATWALEELRQMVGEAQGTAI